jgi:hypothetical protein
MQERVKTWLADPDLPPSIPDSDTLQADFLSLQRKPDNNNNLAFRSKDEMRAKGLRSPDEADAVGLTFASTVYVPGSLNSRTKTPKSGMVEQIKGPVKASWMGG